MQAWVRFFFGTPRRIGVTLGLIAVVIAAIFPQPIINLIHVITKTAGMVTMIFVSGLVQALAPLWPAILFAALIVFLVRAKFKK